MKADLSPSMPPTAPPLDSGLELETEREQLITNADALVSESLKHFLKEVQRYAPPPFEIASDQVYVSVQGTHHADTSGNPV